MRLTGFSRLSAKELLKRLNSIPTVMGKIVIDKSVTTDSATGSSVVLAPLEMVNSKASPVQKGMVNDARKSTDRGERYGKCDVTTRQQR